MKPVKAVIIDALHRLAETDDISELLRADESTALIGQNSPLDSAALVFLLTDLEESIEREFGKQVTIVDESAFGRQSPFRTVGALAERIESLLAAAR